VRRRRRSVALALHASLQLKAIATRERDSGASRAVRGAEASTIGAETSGAGGDGGGWSVGGGGGGSGAGDDDAGSGRIASDRTSLAPLPIRPIAVAAPVAGSSL
jgi:hypothetical protein